MWPCTHRDRLVDNLLLGESIHVCPKSFVITKKAYARYCVCVFVCGGGILWKLGSLVSFAVFVTHWVEHAAL